MVFSRELTDEEWGAFSREADLTYNAARGEWDPEACLALAVRVAPDVEMLWFEVT